MAVVGEASVRIVGNLKPLSDSLAQAKKMTKDFDVAINASMKKTSSLLRNISNVKPKVDFSGVVKMNQSFDSAIRRIDSINKKVIKPKTAMPSAGFFKGFSDSAENANTSVNRLDQSLKRIASVTAGYLGVRELQRYADAWTSIGNQLAAASQISGIQARSLEDLNKLANESRSGIEATANLYARLMRSTAGVAKSEEEIAKATDAVNKAFKAGGAAASEQAAGIMQLGQALGSGFLQGDELRSIRENAPLVAQAIADEFKTNIAGLKDLGAEGKLTSDRVFKALLNAHEGINKTFATTNATIADGFTRINNAMTEYVGIADKTNGVTVTLNKALNYIADNFATAADMATKFAAVIAGVLVGRSLTSMIRAVGEGVQSIGRFVSALRVATAVAGTSGAVFSSLSAAINPIGAIIGVLSSVALYSYISSSAEATQRSSELATEMEKLGIVSKDLARDVEEATKAIESMSEGDKFRTLQMAEKTLKELKVQMAGISAAADRGALNIFTNSQADRDAYRRISQLAKDFDAGKISAQALRQELDLIRRTPVDQHTVKLIDTLQDVAKEMDEIRTLQASLGVWPEADVIIAQLDKLSRSVQYLNDQEIITDIQRSQIQGMIDEVKETGVVTDEMRAKLEALAATNPNMTPFINQLVDLAQVMWGAVTAGEALIRTNMALGASGTIGEQLGPDATAFYAKRDFIKEQERINKLTAEELALENEILKIRKRSESAGVQLGAGEAERLARESLAAAEARRKSTRAGGGGRTSSRSGGGRSSREQLSEYQKALRSIEESVAALQAEQEILQTLDPTINDYGFSMARATKIQELLSMAKRSGIELSKEEISLQQMLSGEFGHLTGAAREQAEAIYFAADSYAAAEANGALLAERNREIKASYDEIQEASRSAMTGFVSDMVKGKSAAEALSNALGKLADALLKVGLDLLFGASGSGGFGAIGKLFGFASGGYTGNGGKYEPAGVVHKGEFVFSKEATKSLGVDKLYQLHNAAKRGFASGGYVGGMIVPNSSSTNKSGSFSGGDQHVTVSVDVRTSVDKNGNLESYVRDVSYDVSAEVTRDGISSFNNMLPDRFRDIQNNPRKRSRQ